MRFFTVTALTFRVLELEVVADSGSRAVRYRGILSADGVAPDAVVPEPSTLVLAGAGALAIARRARRRPHS